MSDLSSDEQKLLQTKGWEWERLTPFEIQSFIGGLSQQLQNARMIRDAEPRARKLEDLLSRIRTALSIKAKKIAARGIKEVRSAIRKTETKSKIRDNQDALSTLYIDYLRREESRLLSKKTNEDGSSKARPEFLPSTVSAPHEDARG